MCQSISAGSRHTLFVMINCRKELDKDKIYKKGTKSAGRKNKIVLITGKISPIDSLISSFLLFNILSL